MMRLFNLWRRFRGFLNLMLGKAVNEDPRRRATWVTWGDEDPTLGEGFSDNDPRGRPHA